MAQTLAERRCVSRKEQVSYKHDGLTHRAISITQRGFIELGSYALRENPSNDIFIAFITRKHHIYSNAMNSEERNTNESAVVGIGHKRIIQ